MADLQHSDKPGVTLEQLLHLKRSERPDSTFWDGFDQELHRRQLASIVTGGTWYVRLARVTKAGIRRAAPLAGAATVLALAGYFFANRTPTPVPETVSVQIPSQEAVAMVVPEPMVQQLQPTDLSSTAQADDAVADPITPERPDLAESHYVISEVAMNETQVAKYVFVTSPDTLPLPHFDAGAHGISTLNGGNVFRTSAYSTVGSY